MVLLLGPQSQWLAPNYEAPTDTSANNVYDITVTANDGVNTSTARAVAITVTNVNDNTPVITSAATASFAENGTGTVYSATGSDADAGTTLSYALGGTDAAKFNINASTGAVTFVTAPNYEAPTDAGGDNVYDITVTANDGVNTSAAQAVAITVTNVGEAGESVIDLGAYGKLIAPVQVEGAWYYYWDRSGNGTSANTGSLNGGVDYTTHDVLDGIFTQDINGVTGGAGNTTDTYRYATLNGVHVALPTANGNEPAPVQAQGTNQNGTTYQDSGATTNGTTSSFNELLAIWDAYNGDVAGYGGRGGAGIPPGWQANGYWSATPWDSRLGETHVNVGLQVGYVYESADGGFNSVALQVLPV